MKIPIRMIGIATTFFWIFLIAFFVSAAYSARDIQFDFGDPQTGLGPNNDLFISLPIAVVNRGFYNVDHFNVTSRIVGRDGFEITRGSTIIQEIRKGEAATALHNLTFSVNQLLQRDQDYLFNDSEMRVDEAVGLRLAEVIPVQAEANLTLPWGAPLYNFRIGEPQYSAYNATHLRAIVPVSFENHAFFDLVGNIELHMYNDANTQTGYGRAALTVTQHTRYDGVVEFYLPMSGIMANGRFEVYFFSPLFDYGPWVVPYG